MRVGLWWIKLSPVRRADYAACSIRIWPSIIASRVSFWGNADSLSQHKKAWEYFSARETLSLQFMCRLASKSCRFYTSPPHVAILYKWNWYRIGSFSQFFGFKGRIRDVTEVRKCHCERGYRKGGTGVRNANNLLRRKQLMQFNKQLIRHPRSCMEHTRHYKNDVLL